MVPYRIGVIEHATHKMKGYATDSKSNFYTAGTYRAQRGAYSVPLEGINTLKPSLMRFGMLSA